ncbi:YycC family protein [Paenibacillus marchantiophytorum]|uniref:YycC family protein n=2 Tax=Paenibacillus marchantiophytorum TaxID=1619310 RepID=A0ABQ1EM00_9BACL|nr:YycC family protein [Paenibacillus marchantiophytorum]
MTSMKPLQISPETAVKLAEQLKVPLEHLMHMPQHILLQKLAELAKSSATETSDPESK